MSSNPAFWAGQPKHCSHQDLMSGSSLFNVFIAHASSLQAINSCKGSRRINTPQRVTCQGIRAVLANGVSANSHKAQCSHACSKTPRRKQPDLYDLEAETCARPSRTQRTGD
eukprot:4320052-Amphidinium_carterae.1